MKLQQALDDLAALAEELLADAERYRCEDLGFDERAGFDRVYVGDDFIAVRKEDLCIMEYYGGLEYSRNYLTCISEYAFWSTEDKRVYSHWEKARDVQSA